MTSLLSSGLLAASLLVGQAGDARQSAPAPLPAGVQGQPGPQIIQSSPGQPSRPLFGWFSREDRPIMSKLQSLWKKDQRDIPASNSKVVRETTSPISNAPAPPITNTPAPPLTNTPAIPNDFPRKMPNPQSQSVRPSANNAKKPTTETPDLQQTKLQNLALPNVAKYPILPANTNRIGRDEKFEWITGQIEIENGNTILYYATQETVDMYSGRIVLMPQKSELTQFKSGDLITVRGSLNQQKTMQGIVPIYRVSEAHLIERSKS